MKCAWLYIWSYPQERVDFRQPEAAMEWTEQRIEMLRRLWGQGQTASQIAAALGGVTRNAVIGKAHRLGLTGRPSPIKRDAIGDAPKRRPAARRMAVAPQPKPMLPVQRTNATAQPNDAASPRRRLRRSAPAPIRHARRMVPAAKRARGRSAIRSRRASISVVSRRRRAGPIAAPIASRPISASRKRLSAAGAAGMIAG